MKKRYGPVLTLSDLTQRSDAAIHCAGRLAARLGSDLHVLHGLGLTGRSMRETVPVLQDVVATIRWADNTIRAQLRRVLPDYGEVGAPVIDFDGNATAMVRRARQVDPSVVVTPAGWTWDAQGRQHAALSRETLLSLQAPLLIAGEREPTRHKRVVVIAHSQSLNSEVVEAAGHWSSLIEDSAESEIGSGQADFDVMLLDGGMRPRDIIEHTERERTDLIAVATDSFRHDDVAPALSLLMGMLLTRAGAPAIMLPKLPQRSNTPDSDERKPVISQAVAA